MGWQEGAGAGAGNASGFQEQSLALRTRPHWDKVALHDNSERHMWTMQLQVGSIHSSW